MDFAVNPDTGAVTGTGRLTRMTGGEFLANGQAAVLASLNGFERRVYVRDEYADWGEQAKTVFAAAHDLVIAKLEPTGRVRLQPMRPVAGKMGHTGERRESELLPAGCSARCFHNAMRRRFERLAIGPVTI